MYISRIIIFTIIVNLFVFGFIHADDADEITLSQIEGVWYVISFIVPNPDFSRPVTCFWLKNTRIHNQLFRQDAKFYLKGELKTFTNYGEIISPVIYMNNPAMWNQTVWMYNDGLEMIVFERALKHFQLLSSTPTVLESTKAEFVKIAVSIGTIVTDVTHTRCNYVNMQ